MNRGIVLYGPPASGKDTITAALSQLNPLYQQLPRLKHGLGRTAGYVMISGDQLEALRAASGEVLWENQRYGATYLVTRRNLTAHLTAGTIPVVHLGQAEAVDAVTTAVLDMTWLVVELFCPRPIAAARISLRGTADDASRLRAFDATPPLNAPHLRIDTSVTTPSAAAFAIDAALQGL